MNMKITRFTYDSQVCVQAETKRNAFKEQFPATLVRYEMLRRLSILMVNSGWRCTWQPMESRNHLED